MAQSRKTADRRLKDLRLAMHRIQRGRALTAATKISVLAVAKEAGVSDSLLYNHYPAFVDEIHAATGRTARKQRDDKHQELVAERLKNKNLRADLKTAHGQIAKLASINESQSAEIELLNARIARPKIVPLTTKS